MDKITGWALQLGKQHVQRKAQFYNTLMCSGHGVLFWVAGRGKFMVRGETQPIQDCCRCHVEAFVLHSVSTKGSPVL